MGDVGWRNGTGKMERSVELIQSQSVSSSSGMGITLCTWHWGGHTWVLRRDTRKRSANGPHWALGPVELGQEPKLLFKEIENSGFSFWGYFEMGVRKSSLQYTFQQNTVNLYTYITKIKRSLPEMVASIYAQLLSWDSTDWLKIQRSEWLILFRKFQIHLLSSCACCAQLLTSFT